MCEYSEPLYSLIPNWKPSKYPISGKRLSWGTYTQWNAIHQHKRYNLRTHTTTCPISMNYLSVRTLTQRQVVIMSQLTCCTWKAKLHGWEMGRSVAGLAAWQWLATKRQKEDIFLRWPKYSESWSWQYLHSFICMYNLMKLYSKRRTFNGTQYLRTFFF